LIDEANERFVFVLDENERRVHSLSVDIEDVLGNDHRNISETHPPGPPPGTSLVSRFGSANTLPPRGDEPTTMRRPVQESAAWQSRKKGKKNNAYEMISEIIRRWFSGLVLPLDDALLSTWKILAQDQKINKHVQYHELVEIFGEEDTIKFQESYYDLLKRSFCSRRAAPRISMALKLLFKVCEYRFKAKHTTLFHDIDKRMWQNALSYLRQFHGRAWRDEARRLEYADTIHRTSLVYIWYLSVINSHQSGVRVAEIASSPLVSGSVKPQVAQKQAAGVENDKKITKIQEQVDEIRDSLASMRQEQQQKFEQILQVLTNATLGGKSKPAMFARR